MYLHGPTHILKANSLFRNLKMCISFSVNTLICVVCLLYSGCTPVHKEEVVIRAHADNLQVLMTRMDSLVSVTESLWQDVTYTLESELPESMAADERRNMLLVKNADLIRMFQAFSSLDTALQKKVMLAGEKDKTLAAEIRNVMSLIETEKKNYCSSGSS